MPELEAPTALPSPAIRPAQLQCPPDPPTRPPPDVPEKTIRAGQSKCTICYRWLDTKYEAKAIVRFNQCWNVLRDKAKVAEKRELRKALESHEVEESEEATAEVLQDINSALAELEEPSAPELPYLTDLPTTSCLLCHEDLWGKKALDAFHHRLVCLSTLCPSCCPVCKQSFTETSEPTTEPNAIDISGWEVYDMIWHLHACQNGFHLSKTAQKNWDKLISAYADRIEVAETLSLNLFEERKKWNSQKHRASVKAKNEIGLAKQDGIYRIHSSPLRTSQSILPARKSHSGMEIEITRVEKEVVSDIIPFDQFKQSSYSVLKLPQKSTLRKDYKAKEVVTEIVSFFDAKTFWSKLPYQGKTKMSIKPVSGRFAVASPTKGQLPVDSAAAEDFPVISDKRKERSRPRLLRHSPGMSNATRFKAAMDALPKAPTRLPCSKSRVVLDGNRKTLLALFKKPREEAKRPLSRIPTPSKPVVAGKAVTLPRSVLKFPAITFACPQEELDFTLPQPVRKFPAITFTCPKEKPDNLLASSTSSNLHQTTANSSTSAPPLSSMAANYTTTMRVSPVRLPQTPITSFSPVIMPRRNSLEDTQPYMFPAPYAHAIFFADDSFLVFGEGVVPPPPGAVRYSDAEAGDAVTREVSTDEEDEVSETKVADGDQPEEEMAAWKSRPSVNDHRH